MRDQPAKASGVASEAAKGGHWALFILAVVYTFNYLDRSILNTVGEAVRVDLKLTDMQLGLLGGLAFSLVNGLAGVPIAWCAERVNRVKLVAVALGFWSLMTAACGMAQNFWQLFGFRTLVGIGEAGGPSPSQSLISDYYPARQRAKALSLYYIGVPVGILFGAFFCGWLVEQVGWRWAFVVIGMPGLLLSLLMVLTLKEPPRGQFDPPAEVAVRPTVLELVRRLFSRPSYCNLLFAVMLLNFAALALLQFLHPYFVRTYTLGYAEAAGVFGLIKGVSALLGTLIGGYVSGTLSQRDDRSYAWVPAAGMALAAPLYLIAFQQTHWLPCALLILVASTGHHTYYAPFYAVVHSMSGPRMRAMATAVSALLINGVAIAAGPAIVGLMSDRFASSAFAGSGSYREVCIKAPVEQLASACQAASAQGLKLALMLTSLLFVWACVHYLLAARTLRRDLAVTSGT